MKTEVRVWLALAKQTQGMIQEATSGVQVLSETYADMRDIGFEDEEKEAIDQHYSELNELRSQLASLSAGGARKVRHRTRKQQSKK